MADKRRSEGSPAGGGGGEEMVGCSPASLSSPMSGGGGGSRASSGGVFERNYSLDKFMETLGTFSPDGQAFHDNKRHVSLLCVGVPFALRCYTGSSAVGRKRVRILLAPTTVLLLPAPCSLIPEKP